MKTLGNLRNALEKATRRLFARVKYRDFERDLAQELDAHRAMAEAELRERGLSADEARTTAARSLGNVAYMREEARAVWIARWIEQIGQDLRHAFVMFMRRPAFSLGATAMLGLGLGLLATVYTFADARFFRPWQVPNPDSLRLVRSAAGLSTDFRSISVPEYLYLREHATTMRHLAMTVRGGAGTLRFEAGSERVPLMQVTSGYFEAVGARFIAGRPFLPAEDTDAALANVAVISERLWAEYFGRDPAAVGRTLQLGNTTMTIVGVVSNDFLDGHGSRTEVWRPLSLASRADPRHQDFPHSVLGRLVPGHSAEQAAEELRQLSSQFRNGQGLPPITFNLPDTRPTGGSDLKTTVALVFAALLMVQLVACGNVGNLMLAHAVARQRELAVRLCLGASRGRLVRQLLTEAVLISAAAGVLGMSIVWIAPRVAVATIEGLGERPEYYTPGSPTIALALVLVLTTALAAGLGPALRGTRVNLVTASAGHGPTIRMSRLSRLLLAGQIALATVLIVCASLLTRAIDHASGLDPGFDIDAIQQIELSFPSTVPRSEYDALAVKWIEVVNQASLPPVALSNSAPVENDRYSDFLRTESSTTLRVVAAKNITSNYFDVLGIRLLAGRGPRPTDGDREVVLSQSIADDFWPGESPLGKAVLSGTRSDRSIRKIVVGIAPELPVRSLSGTQPIAYSATENGGLQKILLKSPDPRVLDRLRPLLESVAPGATAVARPLRESLADSLSQSLVGSWIAWAIGAIALILAAVGAAGSFAHAVEERRREIGVRMALGARSADVIRAVMKSTQRPLLLGLGVGILAAQLASSFLDAYMFGLSSLDPFAHIHVVAILALAAIASSWIPTMRATRVDPIEVLRLE